MSDLFMVGKRSFKHQIVFIFFALCLLAALFSRPLPGNAASLTITGGNGGHFDFTNQGGFGGNGGYVENEANATWAAGGGGGGAFGDGSSMDGENGSDGAAASGGTGGSSGTAGPDTSSGGLGGAGSNSGGSSVGGASMLAKMVALEVDLPLPYTRLKVDLAAYRAATVLGAKVVMPLLPCPALTLSTL